MFCMRPRTHQSGLSPETVSTVSGFIFSCCIRNAIHACEITAQPDYCARAYATHFALGLQDLLDAPARCLCGDACVLHL